MTTDPGTRPGPLAGLRVVELCSELGAWAGKLFADMGADVVVVEPPGGDPTRRYGPFADDKPDREGSLWFWYYNTGKRSVVLDLDAGQDRATLRALVARTDIFVEGEQPGRLAALGLDYTDLEPANPGLIMASVTPFGRSGPRAEDPVTDLTLLAGGGAVWMCGYDDHTIPPVRGGGNQGYHIASNWVVQAVLAALLHRDAGGPGQHIDVNAHAAVNVTTEAGSYNWLVARETAQRQTGRHAATNPTLPMLIQCADGRWVNGGIPARTQAQMRSLHEWLASTGLLEKFPEAAVLEWAMESPGEIRFDNADDETRTKLEVARAAANFLATNLTAFEYFGGGQQRGFQLAIVYSPEEALEDAHIKARGFPVEVEHEDLGRTVTYPGAAIRFVGSPMRVRGRAPHMGEHQAEVLAEAAGA